MRPFRFLATAWGADHVGYLVDHCLRSLLAPGNLPSVWGAEHEVLIATTREDAEAIMSRQDIVEALRRFNTEISFALLAHEPTAEMSAAKYAWATTGYEMLTERAAKDRAWGCVLTPDSVISEGTLEAIAGHAVSGGARVVLAPSFPCDAAKLLPRLDDLRAGPLSHAVLDSLHDRTLGYVLDSPAFSSTPSGVLFRQDEGMIAFSMSWAMLLLDYSVVAAHRPIGSQTIDGRYVFDNFGTDDVHVVRDSLEALHASWSPADPDGFFHAPWANVVSAEEAESIKGRAIRGMIERADDLKQRLFFVPCRLSSDDVDDELWSAREAFHARRLRGIARADAPLS